jgi:putative transcriptional regulator
VNDHSEKTARGEEEAEPLSRPHVGVQPIRHHREGRVTLKTREVHPITVPPIDVDTVRETRAALNMSRQVFAFKIGVNPRTLERLGARRSKPNEQAAALL